jgi:hypothetical protein
LKYFDNSAAFPTFIASKIFGGMSCIIPEKDDKFMKIKTNDNIIFIFFMSLQIILLIITANFNPKIIIFAIYEIFFNF